MTTSLRERIEREADAHDYFAANADLRMTTGDHAARAEKLRAIAAALSTPPAEGGECDCAAWGDPKLVHHHTCPLAFADWLAQEMPSGTIIGDPRWWAPRILRQIGYLASSNGLPELIAAARDVERRAGPDREPRLRAALAQMPGAK